jgi:GNAT superfamily N-acetyltransferase
MISRRFFSTLTKKPTYHFQLIKPTPEMTHMLRSHKFTLARYFNHTLENKENWRNTEHHLLLIKTPCNKPVAFAGIEVGDGKTIQSYIEKYFHEPVFQNKTCILHAIEVNPAYQKRGFQMFLWKKLCEWAHLEKIDSIIWEPVKEENYRNFLNKFNLTFKEHLLSKFIEHGDYFDGEGTTLMHQEDVTRYFQIEKDVFAEFSTKLEAGTKDLDVETHEDRSNSINNRKLLCA